MGKQHVIAWAFAMSALKTAQFGLSNSWTKHQKLQDWLKIVVWFCFVLLFFLINPLVLVLPSGCWALGLISWHIFRHFTSMPRAGTDTFVFNSDKLEQWCNLLTSVAGFKKDTNLRKTLPELTRLSFVTYAWEGLEQYQEFSSEGSWPVKG